MLLLFLMYTCVIPRGVYGGRLTILDLHDHLLSYLMVVHPSQISLRKAFVEHLPNCEDLDPCIAGFYASSCTSRMCLYLSVSTWHFPWFTLSTFVFMSMNEVSCVQLPG